MLCTVKFKAENQEDYSAEWGVVFSKEWGKRINNWSECQGPWTKKFDRKIYSSLEADIQKIWDVNKMTASNVKLRNGFMTYMKEKVVCVYPDAHLVCSGSSVSKCGSISSDMDLCFVLKTPNAKRCDRPHGLPIEDYSEAINKFMIDRINITLRQYDEIDDVHSRDARVPIVKFRLSTKVVDKNLPETIFDFDINYNCVAGVYNSYLLGGFSKFDKRFPKLAIIMKQWGKNVGVIHSNGRFNSYLVTLLVVHYLQCGVFPPVLPNLMKACPEDYDGTKEPWTLKAEIKTYLDNGRLPTCQNEMNVGALLCGLFDYYFKFDFRNYGILIRDASIIDKSKHGQFKGGCNSMIFVEEPYDGLTVSKNIDKEENFEHIMSEFKIANHLMHPKDEGGKLIAPKLATLLGRIIPEGVLTTKEDATHIIKS